jgi:hypothetical protein
MKGTILKEERRVFPFHQIKLLSLDLRNESTGKQKE